MLIPRIRPIAVVLAAVAVSIAAVTPAKAAVSSVRITAGTATGGTANFTMSSGPITLRNLSFLKNGGCSGSKLTSGQGTLGTHRNPAAAIAGTSSTTTFASCVLTLGANVGLTITGAAAIGSPWRMQADDPTTNTGGANQLPPSNPVAGQTTPVTVYNIYLKVTTASCSFPVTGSVSGGAFSNTTSGATVTLPAKTTAATSNLTVGQTTLASGATSCVLGLFHAGDKISLATTYTISASGTTPNPIWLNAG